MGVDHAWEKFSSAIRFVLVSDVSLQERLGVVISDVCLLQRDSFPDERVWEEFRKLMNETTPRESRQRDEGRIRAAIARMSEEEVKEGLQTAFQIFCHLAKAIGRTEFAI